MKYPVRARIVDAAGTPIGPLGSGLVAATPESSRPHVGKEGLAERVDGLVRITLDDGAVLWGYECWWEPLPTPEKPPL